MSAPPRRRLAAGNWKMHGDAAALEEIRALAELHPEPGVEIVLCPPAALLERAARIAAEAGGHVTLGGQDSHAAPSGAHTGDHSAAMLREAGAAYVILGHSERRARYGEDDGEVRAKAAAAIEAGLVPIVCLGETEGQRDAGEALRVIEAQLAGSVPEGASAARLVVAYEPVWAIGTGRTPSLEQIGEVHALLRRRLDGLAADPEGVRLLYGGSVKPANAAEIFAVPEVDGALVGGASLRAAEFTRIVAALEDA